MTTERNRKEKERCDVPDVETVSSKVRRADGDASEKEEKSIQTGEERERTKKQKKM
jgi:hypothetical protein